MSGVPLAVGDLPAGTLTVRVVRGALSNAVAGQEVEIVVAGNTRTVKTNDAGRAEFSGLPPGARVRAATTLDGERLESQEFAVPAAGGIRMLLVGPLSSGGPQAQAPSGGVPPAAAPTVPQGPAQAGSLVLGDQTRFVFEMGDEALTGFYILQLVNRSTTPVQPAEPFTVQLPKRAERATVMQGSSPQATISGTTVNVAGPFAPGQTQVQVAFTLPYSTGNLTIEQRLPAALSQLTLLVEKSGAMQISSPQVAQHREVQAENDTYYLGQGPGLAAGTPLTVAISGLPHAPLWPRNLALALAATILVVGLGAAARPGRAATAEHARRQKLDQKRDRLFEELASVEEQHRAGTIDPARYAARRAELVRALERTYAELDAQAAA
jgi:hypothetical protein